MNKDDLLIGLTGGIGSGKSRVAKVFATRGSLVIDADQVARSLLQPGQKGWKVLQKTLESNFFKDDKSIDRQRLRSAIFSDHELKKNIDELLHPLIRKEIDRLCSEGRTENFRLIVVEVPLLFEVGWQEDFDLVIVVEADSEVCLERIMSRDGVSRPEAEQALAAQMDIGTKVALADHVIDNGGVWDDTVRQVEELIGRLTAG